MTVTRKTATSLLCGAAGLILLPFSPEVLGRFVPWTLAGVAAGCLCWLLADYVNVVRAISLRLELHALWMERRQAQRKAGIEKSWRALRREQEGF